MQIENILIYYMTWMLPSATALYILLHEKYKIGRIKSYIISCFIAGTIMYPIEHYVFLN